MSVLVLSWLSVVVTDVDGAFGAQGHVLARKSHIQIPAPTFRNLFFSWSWSRFGWDFRWPRENETDDKPPSGGKKTTLITDRSVLWVGCVVSSCRLHVSFSLESIVSHTRPSSRKTLAQSDINCRQCPSVEREGLVSRWIPDFSFLSLLPATG